MNKFLVLAAAAIALAVYEIVKTINEMDDDAANDHQYGHVGQPYIPADPPTTDY